MVSKVDNSVESDDDQEIEIKSLQDIIKEYIDAIPDISDEDREALVKYSNELYIEATQ